MRAWVPDPDAGYIARDVRRGGKSGPGLQPQHVAPVENGFQWRNHRQGGRMTPIPRDRWDEALAFAEGS